MEAGLMPRCLECEKNKTIEETKNNAAETAELMFKPFKNQYL